MRDLFVLTADADMLAVLRSVLGRPESLGIRSIDFEVDRHPMRDSGMVSDGADLVRNRKRDFKRLVLLWDHQGSGSERRRTAEESGQMVQTLLDQVSWRGRSVAIAIDRELEEWLWWSPAAIASHLGVSQDQLRAWLRELGHVDDGDAMLGSSLPKEALEEVFLQKRQKTISPRDFERIASRASLKSWRKSPSFDHLVTTLQEWFPCE